MFEEFGNNKAQLIIGRMVDSINLEVFSKEMIDNEFNEIYLGEMQETNKKTFHIGRIHFHLKWGLTGFCSYSVDQDELPKWKRIVFMLCGPLASLLFLMMLYLVVQLVQPIDFIRELMNITMIFTSIQFLLTIIPIHYPSWYGGYGGRPSDGYQALQIVKE